MEIYTREELNDALQVITSNIRNCEKIQPKFAESTSQHSLLRNRIKALYISKALIANEDIRNKYTTEELTDALRPVLSIISKCEKGQLKFTEGSPHHTRFKKQIRAMNISKEFITKEINCRG
ncbi:MAG: hypothetical protein K0R00_776 [Herbinix sp.]|jgi:hypothetical protein|nr:hypothetical protein [Herbinix sp.]